MSQIVLPPCDLCGRAVPIVQGRLLLKEDDVNRYWTQQLEIETSRDLPEATREPAKGPESHAKQLSLGPDAIRWHWGHEHCLPDSRYVIVAGRFETSDQLLDWTYQLLNDALVARTNWRETVRRFYHIPVPVSQTQYRKRDPTHKSGYHPDRVGELYTVPRV